MAESNIHTMPCPNCHRPISERVETVVRPRTPEEIQAENYRAIEREMADPMNRIHRQHGQPKRR